LEKETEEYFEAMAAATKSFSSLLYLLPRKLVWSENKIFVSGPQRNYTLSDWYNLLIDIGSGHLAEFLSDVDQQLEVEKPPNVEVINYFF